MLRKLRGPSFAFLGSTLFVCTATLHYACSSSEPNAPIADGDASDVTIAPPRKDAATKDADGDSDAAVVSASFLNDPQIWKPVAKGEDCDLVEATVVPDPFPKRVWSTCGEGCRVANGSPPIESSGSALLSGVMSKLVNGDLVVGMHNGVIQTAAYYQAIRMSDEATVAAVQIRKIADCGFGYQEGDAPGLVVVRGPARNDGASQWLFGRASLEIGHGFVWQDQWIDTVGYPIGRFSFALGFGLYSEGTFMMLESAAASAFSFTSVPGQNFAAAGQGDLLVAARLGDDGGVLERVAGDASTSVALSFAQDETPIAVGMDETTVAWVTAIGSASQTSIGSYEKTRLRWAPRSGETIGAPSGELVLSDATSAGYRPLRVGQGYAATAMCLVDDQAPANNPTCTLFVAHLPTNKLWKLKGRSPGNAFVSVIGVSNKEIVVAESDVPLHPPFAVLERIVRLDVGKLDVLAQP